MGDISHNYGSDIDLSASGDLLYLPDPTQQRVIKRFLTTAGDDICNLLYGAGAGAFVGLAGNQDAIANAILSQIYQESTVAQIPPPIITFNEDMSGNVTVNISYTDAATGETVTLAPLTFGN